MPPYGVRDDGLDAGVGVLLVVVAADDRSAVVVPVERA